MRRSAERPGGLVVAGDEGFGKGDRGEDWEDFWGTPRRPSEDDIGMAY